MPRHMLPQVGTTVWYFADPTRRPQAAMVTKRISPTNYVLTLFNPAAGTASGATGVPFYELGAKPTSGIFCTPTGIQDDLDGASDTTSLSQRATAVASIVAGGANYVVGDILGVTGSGVTGLTIRVSTVSAGAVTAATVNTGGNVVKPGPAGTLTTTGGTGTGCTVTITWADN